MDFRNKHHHSLESKIQSDNDQEDAESFYKSLNYFNINPGSESDNE